jgi:tetratricopeptide (TPR) repeat protein
MRATSALALLLLVTSPSFAKTAAHPATPGALGHVDFPVTGGEAARQHFARGLLALHSFWYEEARDEFREATRAEPRFAMGYWGEALTFYHPVWNQEDVAAEKKALDAAPAHPEVTQRELAYLGAARTLVGDGDFAAHAQRYATAMKALHERWPDDDEASTLYAVAILGTVDRKSTAFKRPAEAAALSLEVFARNPDHPGAAHYIIHAFDDPDHALLALPAARRYAQIAPEAFHARHMPSHIFVHLGMWTEAAAANESSWEASQTWIRKKKLDAHFSDTHSLGWLHAIYLELGQRAKANEVLARGAQTLADAHVDHEWMRVVYARMAAKSVIEADDWAHLDEKLAPLAGGPAAGAPPTVIADASSTPQRPLSTATSASCHPVKEADAATAARRERTFIAYLRGEAALARRDAAGATRAAETVASLTPKSDDFADTWRAIELSLRGRAAAVRGNLAAGLKQLTQAAELEDRELPSGPIELGVSARERLGETLLSANRGKDALREFRRALELHPRRARVLLGCARAATSINDPAAPGYWSELASVWQHADSDTPGFEEMRRAVAAR